MGSGDVTLIISITLPEFVRVDETIARSILGGIRPVGLCPRFDWFALRVGYCCQGEE